MMLLSVSPLQIPPVHTGHCASASVHSLAVEHTTLYKVQRTTQEVVALISSTE